MSVKTPKIVIGHSHHGSGCLVMSATGLIVCVATSTPIEVNKGLSSKALRRVAELYEESPDARQADFAARLAP